MADIELVIKMPESIWVAIQNGEYCGILDDRTYNAIKNGTPLPKGHGRLIDADKLKKTKHDIYIPEINYRHRCVHVENIDEAPTILEADKEEEEVAE